jgi:hypothetical protein
MNDEIPVPFTEWGDFEKYRITTEQKHYDTPPIIMIGGAKVAAVSNITAVTAEAKAGKTAVTSVFLAGAISETGKIDGFKDVHVVPNKDKKAVIHFDTEQSPADQQYNLKTILKRANLSTTPDHFLSYNIRTISLKDYRIFGTRVCHFAQEKFGGIHLIVVDGAADFINSINDEEEANAIILYFTQMADFYGAPVLLIIHLNENAGKNGDTMPRGHLGRQAVRKGYAQINIIKDKDISIMQTLRARKASSEDTPLVAFKFSQEKGYHVSVDADELKNNKADNRSLLRLIKIQTAAEKILQPPNAYRHDDLRSEIERYRKVKKTQAKEDIGDMVTHRMVTVGEDGYYRLNPDREKIILNKS